MSKPNPAMRTDYYRAGETIVAQGDLGDAVYIIRSGSVEVIVGEDSKSRIVSTLGAGEIFGEMGSLDPGPRSATVKATTDTRCVVTTFDELTRSFSQDPEQAMELMKVLARRLRHMNELVQTLQPGKKRRLRDIFNDWQETFEDAKALAHKSEKMLHMV